MSATDVRRIARVLALAFATGQAQAQNPPVITDADIERARRETPTVTEQDIEAARRKYALPSGAEPPAAPAPNPPDIDALPQPDTRTPIDLEALARALDVGVRHFGQGLAESRALKHQRRSGTEHRACGPAAGQEAISSPHSSSAS